MDNDTAIDETVPTAAQFDRSTVIPAQPLPHGSRQRLTREDITQLETILGFADPPERQASFAMNVERLRLSLGTLALAGHELRYKQQADAIAYELAEQDRAEATGKDASQPSGTDGDKSSLGSLQRQADAAAAAANEGEDERAKKAERAAKVSKQAQLTGALDEQDWARIEALYQRAGLSVIHNAHELYTSPNELYKQLAATDTPAGLAVETAMTAAFDVLSEKGNSGNALPISDDIIAKSNHGFAAASYLAQYASTQQIGYGLDAKLKFGQLKIENNGRYIDASNALCDLPAFPPQTDGAGTYLDAIGQSFRNKAADAARLNAAASLAWQNRDRTLDPHPNQAATPLSNRSVDPIVITEAQRADRDLVGLAYIYHQSELGLQSLFPRDPALSTACDDKLAQEAQRDDYAQAIRRCDIPRKAKKTALSCLEEGRIGAMQESASAKIQEMLDVPPPARLPNVFNATGKGLFGMLLNISTVAGKVATDAVLKGHHSRLH